MIDRPRSLHASRAPSKLDAWHFPTSPVTRPPSAPRCSPSTPTGSSSISPTATADPANAPSARSPPSRSTRSAGADTVIDLAADTVRTATLNGRDSTSPATTSRPAFALTGLAEHNVVVVDADCRYSNTGEGLHRFVDPVDGEVYLYSQFETADAKRMFACFDQPDLKATFDRRRDRAAALAGGLQRRHRVERRGTACTRSPPPRG